MAEITKEKAKEILHGILLKYHKRFKQELEGENEELLPRTVQKYREQVARYSWKASQKWCKWVNEGPVLMPDHTRIYYRKGNTEIVLQELPPQVRIMKFRGSLARRDSSTDKISIEEGTKVFHYSLAIPYLIFIFKFVEGMFFEVKCAFSDRPLKRCQEMPIRPYLSNIDSNLTLCLGRDFDESLLEKDNISQQTALVMSHFWDSAYSDEWSSHFWSNKAHFQECDQRLSTLEDWQKNSIENPLFVIEDVKWIQYEDDNFGDMIVRMLECDSTDNDMGEELYSELVEEFLGEITKTYGDNLNFVDNKVRPAILDLLAEELVEKIKPL